MQNSRPIPLLRTWLVAISALLVLAAAACGGDDDAAEDGRSADAVGSEDPNTDDENDTGSGSASATVTVDGVTYEATEEQSCFAVDEFLGAVFTNADQTVRISVSLSPTDDAERSEVRVDDETDPDDEVQFESGGEVVDSNPGFRAVAQVHEHTVDGRHGSGSATFIDTTRMMSGTATPVEGTFDVQCADL